MVLASETYNFINYLKIVDLSILNLFDFIDINENKNIIEVNDKYVLNFNATCKKLLEGFVVNNINDSTYLNNRNILINTCSPYNNWRSINRDKLNKSRISLADDSIYIDEIKLNQFIDALFKRLPTLNATLNKKILYQKEITKTSVSIQKNIEFIEIKDIDQFDLYSILEKIFASFGGTVNRDCGFKYNIIKDNNVGILREEQVRDELFEEVRLTLIQKGII